MKNEAQIGRPFHSSFRVRTNLMTEFCEKWKAWQQRKWPASPCNYEGGTCIQTNLQPSRSMQDAEICTVFQPHRSTAGLISVSCFCQQIAASASFYSQDILIEYLKSFRRKQTILSSHYAVVLVCYMKHAKCSDRRSVFKFKVLYKITEKLRKK